MKTLNVNSILKSSKLQYKIEKVLGQGSFGITYLASTTIKVEGPLGSIETPIKVAIKEFFMRDINGREEGTVTCSNQNGLYDRYKEKFIKEAQNLSKLKHRHIIKVLEVFEANNTYYYVMEFCEGGSLDDEIAKRGNLTEEETKRYARQIADALSYMHDNKMLHLDLKPGNAMLRGDGDVVLIDFGLSKQYDENGQPESSTTIGGGTPGYAPIEQSNYDGKGFPKTMDIYALGGTMFKMLTGKRPPEASIILNCGFPSEELRQQGVSEQTIGCIERSMSFRVADRPQSIADFLKLLDGEGVKTQDDDEATEIVGVERPKPTEPKKEEPKQELPNEQKPKKKKSKAWIFILLAIILGGAGYLSWRALYISAKYISAKYTALMVEGDNFLNTGQYEFARFRYETALKLEEDHAILCDIGILSGESRDKLALVQEKEQEAAQIAQAQKEAEAKQKAEAERKRKEEEAKRKAEQERLEKEKMKSQTFTVNGVSFTMIKVEGGTFQMGATSEQGSDTYDDEKPVHSVTLSDYYIGETEVTQELWEAVMGSTLSNFKGSQKSVGFVSWHDCKEFITKLNELTGKNFRLPTEAEWEYAARGGNKSKGYKYSGSNTIDDVAWYYDNSGNETHKVKTKLPNELGIYDMSGNVLEWCEDWYGDYSSGSQTNPTGPSSGSYRVHRGGSWHFIARGCRVSLRFNDNPDSRIMYNGLRLCLSQY